MRIGSGRIRGTPDSSREEGRIVDLCVLRVITLSRNVNRQKSQKILRDWMQDQKGNTNLFKLDFNVYFQKRMEHLLSGLLD